MFRNRDNLPIISRRSVALSSSFGFDPEGKSIEGSVVVLITGRLVLITGGTTALGMAWGAEKLLNAVA